MPGPSDPWTDGSLAARLRKLWKAKDKRGNTLYSTAAIGRQLGVSKNSIVGKAHRIGLPGRPSPIKRTGKALKPRPPVRPGKVTLPPLPSTVPTGSPHVPTRKRSLTVVTKPNVRTAEITPTAPTPRPYGRIQPCCWPLGDPGTHSFRFCEQPSDPGKAYCSDHYKLAYVSIRDRREDEAA